uniref:Uncharacterized protein n=1 Tax=Zea mays TaxID=4577 RepID=A0A804PGQ0_MAIZE
MTHWRSARLSSLTGLSPSARSLTTSVPPPLGSSRMPTRPSGPLKLTVLMVTVPPAPPTALFPVRPSASLSTKKYTRFEAQVLALRADPATFTREPEDSEGFGKWSALFSIDEMKEQIETVLHESPGLESFVEGLVPSVNPVMPASVGASTQYCATFFCLSDQAELTVVGCSKGLDAKGRWTRARVAQPNLAQTPEASNSIGGIRLGFRVIF